MALEKRDSDISFFFLALFRLPNDNVSNFSSTKEASCCSGSAVKF